MTINIIGIGATGSKVCLALLRRGLIVRAFDFDKVSDKNLLNQIYRYEDIGKPKVFAMDNIAKSIDKDYNYSGYDVRITTENIRRYISGGTVLVLTDTMESRIEIYEALKLSHINRLIETRVGENDIYVYAVPLNKGTAITDKYENTFSVTPQSAQTLCGARVEMNSTTDIASGFVQTLLLEKEDFAGEIYLNRISPVYYIDEWSNDE